MIRTNLPSAYLRLESTMCAATVSPGAVSVTMTALPSSRPIPKGPWESASISSVYGIFALVCGIARKTETLDPSAEYIAGGMMMEARDDPRLQKAIDEFNQQLFFECHETLEEIWIEEHGSDRKFYQGIIQIAAGYFKWQQGVPAGAIKLWRSGLEKIAPYEPVYLGVELEGLARSVKVNLKELESFQGAGETSPSLNVPQLRRVI